MSSTVSQRIRRRERRQEKKEKGLCTQGSCTNKSKKGFYHCEFHYQQNRKKYQDKKKKYVKKWKTVTPKKVMKIEVEIK